MSPSRQTTRKSTAAFVWLTSLGIIAAALAVLWPAQPISAQTSADSILHTKHNLGASGPGQVKVAGSPDLCKFCHTPHAANPIAPLWNRHDSGAYYQTYESSTLAANVGQPTGSSRLCLSCHDGTIALQQTFNPRNTLPGTIFLAPGDAGYLGTDLRDDHPISFVYDSSLVAKKPQLRHPDALPLELPLDHNQQLQCTTCHDPHTDRFGNFLRMDNRGSAMCVTCHQIADWSISVHATSNQPLTSASGDYWPDLEAGTVADAACASCHRPHTAAGRARLLRHAAEEDNCFTCHDGSVARADIMAATMRMSSHPVRRTTGIHDPVESPWQMSEHVECADCHNAHTVSRGSGADRAPLVKAAMNGVSGVTRGGTPVTPADYEYQVCYKCHAGPRTVIDPLVTRVDPDSDLARKFAPGNLSYHPVEAAGVNPDVPSLKQGWNTSSMIYCTDCHSADPGAPAKGPHGSMYRPLLARDYRRLDGAAESPAAYDLCYQCHNRNSILNDESFEHKKHIVDEKTPCAVCHDPHGVRTSTHLINFDRDVVFASPSAGTGPTFNDAGRLRGSCTLKCHGKDHNNEPYPD